MVPFFGPPCTWRGFCRTGGCFVAYGFVCRGVYTPFTLAFCRPTGLRRDCSALVLASLWTSGAWHNKMRRPRNRHRRRPSVPRSCNASVRSTFDFFYFSVWYIGLLSECLTIYYSPRSPTGLLHTHIRLSRNSHHLLVTVQCVHQNQIVAMRHQDPD